jgi:drug/metabolite transporter (DMT)-like permease
MLQRMQTIWLLLAAACGLLTFKYSFYSGNKPGDNGTTNFEHLTATTSIIILVLSVAIISSVVIDIFLYKNRKLQLRILLAAIIASLLNIFLYFRQTQHFVQGTYSLTSIFVFAIPVFLILAARGIYKDQKLVKSLDRLR